MSFLFRNKWPVIALCFVGKRRVEYEFGLIINGKQFFPSFGIEYAGTSAFDTDHIILIDLQLKALFGGKIGRLHIENGWNHVEISLLKNDELLIWMRILVLEQENNMDDIQFINPDIILQQDTYGVKRKFEQGSLLRKDSLI